MAEFKLIRLCLDNSRWRIKISKGHSKQTHLKFLPTIWYWQMLILSNSLREQVCSRKTKRLCRLLERRLLDGVVAATADLSQWNDAKCEQCTSAVDAKLQSHAC